MAANSVENISRNLWPSKLKLLEAEYENTKLLVQQETLKCQKWKQEIDLLIKEEKLHQKSLNVRKLHRTVKQKDNEIEVNKQTSENNLKKLEDLLRIESETKLTAQQESHKKEKDKLEEEIKFLKDVKSKLETEMKEMIKTLISEADEKMKKQEEKYAEMKEQLEKELSVFKENVSKAEQEIEKLKQENAENILAKKNMEEEIKVIRKTLKTETDEKLIQQVEKSTKEKCELAHEIQQWKEKYAKALEEIENLKKELTAKNVVTKVVSTQTNATKTHNKGITVNTQCFEKGTQADLPKENQNPSTKENENDRRKMNEKAAETHQEKATKKQKKGKTTKKGKTNVEEQRNLDEQQDVPMDDLASNNKAKAVEKPSKTQKRRKKKNEKAEKERLNEDLQIAEEESPKAHEQEDEKNDKAPNRKEEKYQKHRTNSAELPCEDNDVNEVMVEQPFELDPTIAEEDENEVHNNQNKKEDEVRENTGRKESEKTRTSNMETAEVEVNKQSKNPQAVASKCNQSDGDSTKPLRKRKTPPTEQSSSDVSASKAKKLRASSTENGTTDTHEEEESQVPECSAAVDSSEKLAKTTSGTSEEGMEVAEQGKENTEKDIDAVPKDKNVQQNKSSHDKPSLDRPSTSTRQPAHYDISTILNRTKPPVPNATVLHKAKPPVYRPSASIRQSTASDMSMLNGTKPPVYRPSMSIRQSSVSDMSSVLNGTKRRTLYNSKADNSLMISMLPLQESFMNSTMSRSKKANGTMPASLGAFLKSFTAPKLKKKNST